MVISNNLIPKSVKKKPCFQNIQPYLENRNFRNTILSFSFPNLKIRFCHDFAYYQVKIIATCQTTIWWYSKFSDLMVESFVMKLFLKLIMLWSRYSIQCTVSPFLRGYLWPLIKKIFWSNKILKLSKECKLINRGDDHTHNWHLMAWPSYGWCIKLLNFTMSYCKLANNKPQCRCYTWIYIPTSPSSLSSLRSLNQT